SGRAAKIDSAGKKVIAEQLAKLPENRWVRLQPARVAPTRTWGSATFDSERGRILYWGGGHCGYGGTDVDMYDVAANNWVSSSEAPEYPHRLWNVGVSLAGVTFGGNPWTVHGRRVYAFDPISKKMISVRPVQLTTGYVPDMLRTYPGEPRARADAKVKPPTSYTKFVTWEFDPDKGTWEIAAPAPLDVDTLVTTPHGVMGVPVNWRSRLKDSGYLLPFDPEEQKDNGVYLYNAEKKAWQRLGEKQPAPQYLYEMTTLAYDSKRDRLLLHGAGANRAELWAFERKAGKWIHLEPKVAAPPDGAAPTCVREAVYLPDQDVLLTYGRGTGGQPEMWAYQGADNTWSRIELALPPDTSARQASGQNRALVYDPDRRLVLLVLGGGGDRGQASVFALRYDHAKAPRSRN
ncbi:MAG: hypothetical protein AB7K24_13265, partial [Gemmataceae bacterium]